MSRWRRGPDRPITAFRRSTRSVAAAVTAAATILAFSGVAAAHAGGIRSAAEQSLAVPTWLFLATGGAVIGASFLLASFVTDRAFIRAVDAWRRPLPSPGRAAVLAGRVLGVAGLAAVIVVGVAGPERAGRNAAVMLVWVGWWGAFVATAYLVGDAWPAVNPFRAVAAAVPSLNRPYPDGLARWPAVAGLLALVFLEVVTPLADDPRLLAGVVAAYLAVSVAGSAVFGADDWFGNADPVSRLLAAYGRVAPITAVDGDRGDDARRLRLRVPGMGLTETDWVRDRSDVGFVVAVVFVTTYDGFVGTGLWRTVATPVVDAGVPPRVAYLGALLVGYAAFLALYLAAARSARRTADTFVSAATLARRFAPSLLAIAAGYHLAHNAATAVALAPTLLVALTAPLSPPATLPQLVVPAWFGGVGIAAVLAGHLLAVWVAHATAYDLFPDRLQAIRSQYGVTAAMVAYTMVSLWIVTRPAGAPPFI
ncbi:hypothetical protein [Halobaculum sp. D14]|uniref:hypothetical protein n=1 Tax=Halobaculum sp. D14 TaxID=3421642 RepID=UPI003EB90260